MPPTRKAVLRRAGRHVGAFVLMLTALAARGDESTASAAATRSPSSAQQERMTALGYLRFRGAWRTVQEIELIEAGEERVRAEKAWMTRLERMRRDLDRPGQWETASEAVRGIVDPLAMPALRTAIASEPQRRVRVLFLEALAKVGGPGAIESLVAVALDHPDAETRAAAVERLSDQLAEGALPGLVAALGSPDNERLNRAAVALGSLGRQAAVPALVAALVTKHHAVTGDGRPEGSTSVTFGPGGSGLSMGGGKRTQLSLVRNVQVLDALVGLSGVNFGFDIPAWQAWLSTRDVPVDADLRRDG
jgi:hypothetical protein